MPKIEYVSKRFGTANREMIEKVNTIIVGYQAQGFMLTLRQIYYQFVSRDLFPRRWFMRNVGGNKWVRDEINGTPNNPRSYKNLGGIINDARLAGLIDWAAIEDRTREISIVPHWDGPGDIVAACANQFRIDKWDAQKFRPEVWIEKEALAGVVSGVCRELDIPHLSCRGYTSQSEMWSSAMRLKAMVRAGQKPVILHFGDHDPSGIDMSRDIKERLNMFGVAVDFRRMALNMAQVEEHQPPPNPAKVTDSRFEEYQATYGDESWELDALEPAMIVQLIRDEVESVREEQKWDAAIEEENEHREKLRKIAKSLQE